MGSTRKNTLSAWLVALALMLSTVLGGCSLSKLTADQSADLMMIGSVALDRESDYQFAKEALPGNLKTIETFHVVSPDNANLQLLLAKGYNSYALGFLEVDLEKASLNGTTEEVNTIKRRAALHYLRARSYGFKLLNAPAVEDAAIKGDVEATKRALQSLEKEDVPGLFWTTQAWAAAINLSQDNPDMVAALPVVEVMMNRLIALDADYFYGGPLLLLASYHSSRPPMFGGKPEEAKKLFQQAFDKFGVQNGLIAFMYARFYAPQAQDKALFNKMLKHILEMDVEKYPDARLLNEIARERARFWMNNTDELFFD